MSFFFFDYNHFYFFLISSAFLIIFIGFLDDIFDLKPFFRTLLQVSAILMLIISNYKIFEIGVFDFEKIPSYFSVMFTIFCVLILINSINFLDGEDGLASSNMILSILFIFFYSYIFESKINNQLLILLLISLSIFLLLNFNLFYLPKIYLGDAGSNLLGYLIAWFLIYFSSPYAYAFPPELCIWIIAYPVFDMLSIIIHRLINNKSPFKGDLNHNHHKFKKNGYSKFKINIIVNSLSIIFAFLGVFVYLIFNPITSLFVFIFSFILYYYFFYYKIN